MDDDPDITLSFKNGLEEYGFVVDVFNDPLEALSKFKAGVYDILLVDVKMPKMNGFELCQEIERIDNNPKVCFTTAFVTYYESLKEIYPNAKNSCFIRKPIEIRELAQRMATEIKLNRQAKELDTLR